MSPHSNNNTTSSSASIASSSTDSTTNGDGNGATDENADKQGDETQDYCPFEVHAYDALLTMLASLKNQEFNKTNRNVNAILKQFQQKGCILSSDAQESMRRLKNQVNHMSNRLDSFQKALEEIVNDDEAMSLMNLSVLSLKPQMYVNTYMHIYVYMYCCVVLCCVVPLCISVCAFH